MNIKSFFLSRENLLYLLATAVPISFTVWMSLLNNFVIEVAHFDGEQIGILQSIREIPGLLAFSIVYVLWIFRQQTAAFLSLILLGVGTISTGLFTSTLGLYITALLMSVGFHYMETLHSSLCLQWIDKARAPSFLGRLSSLRSFISLAVLIFIFLGMHFFELSYQSIYFIGGGITTIIALIAWIGFEHFKDDVIQEKKLFVRKAYWLYYLLTFLAGARRQIFVVFAGFLLVEKFGFTIEKMVLLLAFNTLINFIFAASIGKFIGYFGEKFSLKIEYFSLIIIFILYGITDSQILIVLLYVLDNLFFTMAIALKTYFQKIADPKDIAVTAGVSFTINHIAAVTLPILLGIIWITSHQAVFFTGACIACISFFLTFLIPNNLNKEF
ncbi:MAG: MFS transporter [Sulfurospirillaceae bacterium]|jgi:hypothetical protein|nr:MFS transporter [Sulfurospirillaceae bacterium]MDD2825976.1 MFS transporter [Sulfurospirillaceae bacterium]